MTIKLVKDDEIRYKKGECDNIKCRMCGNSDTRMQTNGEPIWVKDNNVKGKWTGQFLCYKCYYESDKFCYKCGIEQIVSSIGMTKYYDGNGVWTGKYICDSCHYKNKTDHKNKNITLTVEEGGGSVMDIVIATVLEIPTCSIYTRGKKLPFCLIHGYYGIIGIKTSKLKNNKWYFNINDYILADTYFCIGLDEKLRNIDAVYVISTKERMNSTGALRTGRISITKNSKKYKKFEITSGLYNHIYHNVNIK